jgi:hypothetical protein
LPRLAKHRVVLPSFEEGPDRRGLESMFERSVQQTITFAIVTVAISVRDFGSGLSSGRFA